MQGNSDGSETNFVEKITARTAQPKVTILGKSNRENTTNLERYGTFINHGLVGIQTSEI